MPLDLVNPTPVHKDDDGYEILYKEWLQDGKPRTFMMYGINWMQVTDKTGVYFVPKDRTSQDSLYTDTSFKM